MQPHDVNNRKLIQEEYGGEIYAYYPLGDYVVVAPGVCGGRPTFKYTRLEVSMVLAMLGRGERIQQIVQNYSIEHLTQFAILEAIQLARQAFIKAYEENRRITSIVLD